MRFFVDFMNIRYSEVLIEKGLSPFRYWDDYAMFLFYELCGMDDGKYYELLEEDIKIYSDIQTGTEREDF